MDSLPNPQNISPSSEEENCLRAMRLASITILPSALKVAIDLGLLEIIAKASTPTRMLSPAEIASHLSTNNSDAPSIIDRILRYLASNSIVTCNVATTEDGHTQRLYGLAALGKYFLQNEDGISFAPELSIHLNKYLMEGWKHMKDSTLEGGFPCVRAFGMHWFELLGKDSEVSNWFNETMSNITTRVMKKILEIYNGFEGVSQVVDVGGGWGANLNLIVSKYPNIKGINFDLPQVIKDAPAYPGVEHVGGDMFIEIPRGEVIFLKAMLHDWGDDRCLKLLKACYDSLPEFGKVILVEFILPELPETDIITKTILQLDLAMFHILPGGRERTKQEFETLGREAGFTTFKVVCRAYNYWVMELYKDVNDSA